MFLNMGDNNQNIKMHWHSSTIQSDTIYSKKTYTVHRSYKYNTQYVTDDSLTVYIPTKAAICAAVLLTVFMLWMFAPASSMHRVTSGFPGDECFWVRHLLRKSKCKFWCIKCYMLEQTITKVATVFFNFSKTTCGNWSNILC